MSGWPDPEEPFQWRSLRPYVAAGRGQLRLGITYLRHGIRRCRWVGLTWQ